MAYKLEISLQAIYDAREAADYYEEKRSGLEIIFESTLQQFFDSLLQTPRFIPIYESRYGKANCSGFLMLLFMKLR